MTTTRQLDAALSGRYQLQREIGAGGMATVYLAHDLRHDRQVALKVLRPELSAILGAERFVKEIRTTANLQHPHILPLHDSGEANGLVFYVMPFVDGESLRDRLTRETQLPVADAVRIAREVASALDYAHRRGVVHRDIKPENILLHDGQALVADFGIALAVSAVGGGTRLTETGMSLGTPHYMSPEQAMGEREITPRSDVYALGCVLYEMLVGEPPFTGPTAQAIVARVMTEEPRSPSGQRKSVPAHVTAAVLTALAKLPADRFATAAEFAAALGTPGYTGVGTTMATPGARVATVRWIGDRRTIATLVGTGGLVVLTVLLALSTRSGAAIPGDVTRILVAPDDTTPGLSNRNSLNGPAAVSPDGRIVAFSLATEDTTAIYVQPLDRFEQSTVAGGGRLPFFSPDGRWIGFVRGGSVWKAAVGGGTPIRLGAIETDASAWTISVPGVWHPDGRIYFATPRGLLALPANGGAPRPVERCDTTFRLDRITEMSLAPDGRLLAALARRDTFRLALVSPASGATAYMPDDVRGPAWFAGDLLVFTRERQLYAGAFDLHALRLVGDPVAISDFTNESFVAPGVTAAWFQTSVARRLEPVWVTRSGEVAPLPLPVDDYRWPRLSPDGRRVALMRGDGNGIQVIDLAAGNIIRLADGAGVSAGRTEPVWYRDGSRVVTSARPTLQTYGIIQQAVAGSSGPDTLLAPSPHPSWPTDISPGDSLLLYYGIGPDEEQDLFVLHLRTQTSRRLPRAGAQRGARFSPDGRWIAMQSHEQGRASIIVVPWPALDAQHVVSTDGGEEPTWSRDGRELYFRNGGRMMAVRVRPGVTWSATAPVELFHGPFATDQFGDQSYDVAPDGRFLMLRFSGDSRPTIRVIRNWAAELARMLAEGRR